MTRVEWTLIAMILILTSMWVHGFDIPFAGLASFLIGGLGGWTVASKLMVERGQ